MGVEQPLVKVASFHRDQQYHQTKLMDFYRGHLFQACLLNLCLVLTHLDSGIQEMLLLLFFLFFEPSMVYHSFDFQKFIHGYLKALS